MSDSLDAHIADRLARIQERIAQAAQRVGRRPTDVRLVAVSKRQPVERIAAAVRAGVRDLGENRVQEARDKRDAVLAAIGAAPEPRWHLIGSLQRNKAGLATGLFDSVESVDRASLAASLASHAEAAGRRLPVLLQVNISREPQKAGVAPERAAALLAACREHASLELVGLMAIPAATREPEASRPAFAQLRALRDTLREQPGGESLCALSMGMSGDFEVAIEEGATSVRIGTALFGERDPNYEKGQR
jgi:pyridoxal phosphate enzyme (YggS family)